MIPDRLRRTLQRVRLRAVEPSEEIRQVVTRFFEACRDGDEEAVRNRISRRPGVERWGTDPDEVWRDGDTAARVWGPADA